MTTSALRLERFDTGAAREVADRRPGGESVLVERARAEAFAEGYAAGHAAAKTGVEEDEKAVAALLTAMEAEAVKVSETATADAAAALKALLQSVLPALSAEGFAAEAAAAFTRGARRLGGVEIVASAESADAIEGWMKRLAPNAAATLRIDSELKGAAARATWPGGGVDFDIDAAAKGCLEALANALESLRSEQRP